MMSIKILDAWRIWRIWRDVRGATAIEYGLIAAFIAVAAVGVMGSVGA